MFEISIVLFFRYYEYTTQWLPGKKSKTNKVETQTKSFSKKAGKTTCSGLCMAMAHFSIESLGDQA
jgi:hypothetical protein